MNYDAYNICHNVIALCIYINYRDSAYYFLCYNYVHNNCKSSKVGLKKKKLLDNYTYSK